MSPVQEDSWTAAQPARPARTLSQIVYGPWDCQVVATAARFRLADRLSQGPRSSQALAAEIGAHPATFETFLRACAVIGLVERNGREEFALTELGESLRPDNTALHNMALMNMGEGMWSRMACLHETVRTGRPAVDSLGEDLYAYYTRNPQERAWHAAAMADLSVDAGESLARHYDFSAYSTIVDIGGGLGVLLSRVLTAAAHAKGVVFDLPGIIERARETPAGDGIGDRIGFAAGSFFTDPPPKGDLYLIKNVLCDWSDDDAAKILANCYRGAPSGSRLAVIEWVRPSDPEPSPLDIMSLCLQVVTGGRARTEEEFIALIERAGYRLETSTTIPSGTVLAPSGIKPRPWHILQAIHP